MPKILVVDENDKFLKIFKQALRRIENSTVVTANTAAKALNCAKSQEYDVVISDFRMHDMDRISFLKQMRRLQPYSVRIMVSGLCDREALCESIDEVRVQRFVEEPGHFDTLCNIIQNTLQERKQYAAA
jgi:DNA-binding NtrC family response regulator